MSNSKSLTFLHIALPFAIIAAAAMTARAFDTSWVSSGQPVSSSKLKGDLDEIQSRLPAAWVAFDGTTCTTPNANCTVLAGYNVSGVKLKQIDNTTSIRYTITFTTPMPDLLYGTIGSVAEDGICTHLILDPDGPPTTAASKEVRIVTNCANTYFSPYVNVSFLH